MASEQSSGKKGKKGNKRSLQSEESAQASSPVKSVPSVNSQASTPPKKKKRGAATEVAHINGTSSTPPKAEQVAEPQASWNPDDVNILMQRIFQALPEQDNIKYTVQVENLDWDKIKFGNFSGDDCNKKWGSIFSELRKFRTLTELVKEAMDIVKDPNKNKAPAKAPPPFKHPDMPKKPESAYVLYYREKQSKFKEANPSLSSNELAKLISKKFQDLPEKKKQKYKDIWNKNAEKYKTELEQFKLDHADVKFPEEKKKKKNNNRIPNVVKPRTPMQIFLKAKLVDCPAENKKESEEKYKQQWKTLADGKRVKWIRKAIEEDQNYQVQVKEYLAANPDANFEARSVISKQEVELKLRFDGKPEKPPNSGYGLYSKIMMRELTDTPNKIRMAEIARRWKELTDVERMGYNDQAKEANVKYQAEHGAYWASMTEEEKRQAEDISKKKKKKKKPDGEPAAKKPVVKKLPGTASSPARKPMKGIAGEPKKPASSGYSLYSSTMLKNMPDVPNKLRMGEISKLWAALQESEKEKYKQKVTEMNRKYQKDLQKFRLGLSEDQRKIYDEQCKAKQPKSRGAAAKEADTTVTIPTKAPDVKSSDGESSDSDSDSDKSGDDSSNSDSSSGSSSSSEESSSSDSDSDDEDDDDKQSKSNKSKSSSSEESGSSSSDSDD